METPNHDYNVPEPGTKRWHEPLNENFRSLDTDVEVRGPESDLDEFDPADGAKFLATDTGTVYVGDGSAWSAIGNLDGPVYRTGTKFDGSTTAHAHVAETADDIQPIVDELDGVSTGYDDDGTSAGGPAGGVVKLRRGVYRISEPILLKRGVHLEGIQRPTIGASGDEGPDFSVIEPAEDFPDGESMIRTHDEFPDGELPPDDNPERNWSVRVQNLVVRGTGSSSGVHGIRLGTGNCQVDGVRTHSLGGNDFWAYGAKDLKVWNSSFGLAMIDSWDDNIGSPTVDTQGQFYNCRIGKFVHDSSLIRIFGSVLGDREPGLSGTAYRMTPNGASGTIFNSRITGDRSSGSIGVLVDEGVGLKNTVIENREHGIVVNNKRKVSMTGVTIRDCNSHAAHVKTSLGSVNGLRIENVGVEGDGTVVDSDAHAIYMDGPQPVLNTWTNLHVANTTGNALRIESLKQNRGPLVQGFAAHDVGGEVLNDPTLVTIRGPTAGYTVRDGGTATVSGDGSTREFEIDGLELSDPAAHVEVFPDLSSDATAVRGVLGDSLGADSFRFRFDTAPADGTDNVTVRYAAIAEAGLEQPARR